MTDLSIIIISYNTKEITKKCLETVSDSLNYNPKIKAEIIVVDNASTDSSLQMLKQYQNLNIKNQNDKFNYKLILNTNNMGFAKGNNLGAKQARGKYLLFLNSDTEVIKDAIPKLYNFFLFEQKSFNFLGGKLLNKNLSSQPSCGSFYNLPVVFAVLFLGGDYWGLTRNSPNRVRRVDWVSGACFIAQKTDFLHLGGFDENIFMYMEEVDLFYRAYQKGFKVGFLPSVKFIHLGSASSENRTRPILQVYRGLLYLYKKHYSVFQLWILKTMLKLKALIAVFIGKVFNNQYLVTTYEQAYQIAKDHR